MKKALIGIIAATALLSVGITKAHALENEKQQNLRYAGSNNTCSFYDTDDDGICDNNGYYHRNNIHGNECERYYVDDNEDGVCDNYEAGRCGERRGYGHHGGRHR